jgi:hypothetical protein
MCRGNSRVETIRTLGGGGTDLQHVDALVADGQQHDEVAIYAHLRWCPRRWWGWLVQGSNAVLKRTSISCQRRATYSDRAFLWCRAEAVGQTASSIGSSSSLQNQNSPKAPLQSNQHIPIPIIEAHRCVVR